MTITLQGVRGSIPTTSPETKLYGGNTSCIQVEAEDWMLVLDAGSGIQHVSYRGDQHHNRVDILLTHLHLDHIQGLGFFKPLFDPSTEVHIWGPASSTITLRARLGRYFSPPLFPVYFRNLTCQLYLHEIDESTFDIGPFSIQSCYVIHPGPTLGYRITHQRSVMAYLPDHEPALGRNGIVDDVRWLSGSGLASGANLLLHDAQYTSEEYRVRMGWGHSTMEDAIRFAAVTGAERLLLMHHDPLHSDAALQEWYHQLKATSSYAVPFALAAEGMRLAL
jgi:phosphoribosyl 1,2-cyclic phosphodiesterase